MLSLMFAAGFAPGAYALDTGDIVVTGLKGEVHVTVNGAERAMKAGSVLDTPSSIRTGHDGAIELKQGTTSVSVGPDTLLEFPAQEKRGGAIDRIAQPRGNVFYGIGKRDGGRKLRVETPYLVGVIKGTQFNVASQEDSTTISLFEGRLEVHATDESDIVDLNAGEIATRKRGAKTITVTKMDGKAPTTPPRPTSSTGGDGPGEGGATAPVPDPARGDDGDALLAGGVRANPTVNATVDTAGADVTANAGAAVEVRANAMDVNVGANLGVTPGAVNLAAGTGVDAGPVAASLGTGTAVDVGASGVSAVVDTGATAALGNTTVVDTSTSVTADVGTTTAVAADAGASVAGVDAGVAAAVNASAGTVDLGLNVAGANVNAGVDLGLGTTTTTTSTTTTTTDTTTPVVDVGGLLDGLLRRRGK